MEKVKEEAKKAYSKKESSTNVAEAAGDEEKFED